MDRQIHTDTFHIEKLLSSCARQVKKEEKVFRGDKHYTNRNSYTNTHVLTATLCKCKGLII